MRAQLGLDLDVVRGDLEKHVGGKFDVETSSRLDVAVVATETADELRRIQTRESIARFLQRTGSRW